MIYRFKDEGENLNLEVNRVPGSIYFEIVRPGQSCSDIVSLEPDTARRLRDTLDVILDELAAEEVRR